MRYLSQRYAMPYKEGKAILTDIGTEELGHFEIIGAIVHQLTRNLTMEQIEESGFGPYYIDHTTGLWPQAAGGIPFNACEFQSKGEPITDLNEDLAAEQKARVTYDRIVTDHLDSKNFYAFNPAFDKKPDSGCGCGCGAGRSTEGCGSR